MASYSAWFRSQLGRKIRVYIKGWFTPLHGVVEDVVLDRACVGGKWIRIAGHKNEVEKVEIT